MTSREDYITLGGSPAEADALGLVSRAELGDDNYLLDCAACDGSGYMTEHANDGTHGCSHAHDREYDCRDCDGTGRCPA